ncbi:MAG: DUF2975 domain-containing protein [Pirellulaceae bacterium]
MNRSASIFLQIVIVLFGLAVLAFLLWEPQVEGVNKNRTNFEIYFQDPLLAVVYAGSVPFFVALYQAIGVLGYVGKDQVFSQEVVKALRIIRYCALAIMGFAVLVGLSIVLSGNLDEENPGVPIFMGLLVSVPSIVVATVAAMCERIVQHAVEAKSENDVTV